LMKVRWFYFAVVTALVGCGGIISSTPKDVYSVPVAYDVAMKSAQAQAEYCLRGVTQYPVIALLDSSAQTAQVKVVDTFVGSVWAQFDIVATGPQSSRVTGSVAGQNIWNYGALRAMHAAIEFGVPSCTDYMPPEEKIIKK